MEVQLYVYDLTKGMARNLSKSLLGIQIDAVYHTSIVFDRVEYFFGAGVQKCRPGSTHHGQPMEIVKLGITHLPTDTILEYLEGLRQVYTPESYDLFAHNCNKFSNDFSTFLVGKGLPDHITNLPQRVLDTPFGQMLRPQIDASMRSITQAELPPQHTTTYTGATNQSTGSGITTLVSASKSTAQSSRRFGSVTNVTGQSTLEKQLSSAADSCATIFFTSSTCAPCKLAYPTYDTLAQEYPNSLFVKVDINEAQQIAGKYQIRATPTFMTFSRGAKVDEWLGADPKLLRSNVEKVIQHTFPPHPHAFATAPTLQYGSMKPVTYGKAPPLDKLMAKLGTAAFEPELVSLRTFIEKTQADPRNAPLPDLKLISIAFQTRIPTLPTEVRFAAVDLLRCAMIEPRLSGVFAEEDNQRAVSTTIKEVDRLGEKCPHNLRLVTIHLASNLFASNLFVKEIMQADSQLAQAIAQLITSSLLDATHPTTRVAAASLAFNLAAANYRGRREESREGVAESTQVELAASMLEALPVEQSEESVKALLLALGYFIYFGPQDGELMDLCQALDAKTTLKGCKKQTKLADEVAGLL